MGRFIGRASSPARHHARDGKPITWKSEFLSTAAHELRTPMVMHGFTELLLKRKFSEEKRRIFTKRHSPPVATPGRSELFDLTRIEKHEPAKTCTFARWMWRRSSNVPSTHCCFQVTRGGLMYGWPPACHMSCRRGPPRSSLTNILSTLQIFAQRAPFDDVVERGLDIGPPNRHQGHRPGRRNDA